MVKKRSKFEQCVSDFLKLCKATFWYEPCKIEYTITKNYIPDFVINKGKKSKKPLTKDELKDKVILEVKGYFPIVDMQKMAAVKESNPDLDIRFVFQKDGYCYPRKKGKPRSENEMKYSDWAKKYGFPYHIGPVMPKEWLK